MKPIAVTPTKPRPIFLYNPAEIGCLLLYTSQSMLDELISRPLDEGDVLSNANTLIYMGKIRDGNRIGRGLYVAKHRGSVCDERIIEYKIGDRGIFATAVEPPAELSVFRFSWFLGSYSALAEANAAAPALCRLLHDRAEFELAFEIARELKKLAVMLPRRAPGLNSTATAPSRVSKPTE